MNRSFFLRILTAISLVGTLFLSALQGAEIKFDSDDPVLLQQAINGSRKGDVILIRQPGPLLLTEPIEIKDKTITIIGQDGPLAHTIDGQDITSHFVITGTSEVTLKKLSLVNGNAPATTEHSSSGGSISSSSDLILNNIRFVNNHADADGGAVHQNGGTLDITNCLFEDNSARGNGGAIAVLNATDASISSSGFFSNGLDATSTTVTGSGGAIWSSGSANVIKNSLLNGNYSSVSGGAIYLSGTSAPATEVQQLYNLTLIGNSSTSGDHIYTDAVDGTVKIGNSIIGGDGDLPGAVNVGDAGNNLTGDFDEDLIGDYGGLSRSFPLLPGSGAIDGGNDDLLNGDNTDERGLTRISDGDGDGTNVVDIGAFEVQMYRVSALQIRGSATGGVDDGGFGNPYDPSDDADSIASAENFEALTNSNKADLGDAVGANNAAGAGAIAFEGQVAGMISLKGRELEVRKDVAIYGPGANVLAVDGSGQSRVFGVYDGANLYISGLAVQDGVADTGGGILIDDGDLTMVESSVQNNHAAIAGGGMAVSIGKALIERSAFIGNIADYEGGAIVGNADTRIDIVNTTLSYNQAGTDGGAIWTAGTLNLNLSTLVNNSSDGNAPGVLLSGELLGDPPSVPSPDVTLWNSIFLQGAPSILNNDANLSAGFLLSDATEALPVGSYTPVAPDTPEEPYKTVGELAYNGGGTMSHLPTPGGPAVNTGDNTNAPATDQRGEGYVRPKPTGGTVDIGSIEFQNDLPTILFNPTPGKIIKDSGGSVQIVPAKIEYTVNDDNAVPGIDKVTAYWYATTAGGEKGSLLATTEVQPESYGILQTPVEFSFPYGSHTLIVEVWDRYSSIHNPTTYTTTSVSVYIGDGILPYFIGDPQATVGNLSDYPACEAEVTFTVAADDDESGLDRIELVGFASVDGNSFAIGDYTVTFKAYDNAGNVGEKSLSFSVTSDADNIAPKISVTSGTSFTLPANVCTYDVPIVVSTTDCTSVSLSLVVKDAGDVSVFSRDYADSINELVPLAWGTYTVSVTATDENSNPATSSYTVTVTDNTDPVVSTVWISDVNDPGLAPIVTTHGSTHEFNTRPGYCYVELALTPDSPEDCSLQSLDVYWKNGEELIPITAPKKFAYAPGGATYDIVCVATDNASNTSAAFEFSITVTDEYKNCSQNISWPNALELAFDPLGTYTVESYIPQYLALTDQSRWYKLTVSPGSRITAVLYDLPADYNIVLYKDIDAEYLRLTELLGGDPEDQQLALLGVEFAPDAFSPDAFSPDAFSPDAFSPDAFSPDAFSPDAFSPDAFSPDAFSPDAFSPDAFSPDAFSPDAFSPDAFSPDAFSPDAFSPDAFSPDAFSPDAFSPDAFSPEFYTPDAFSPDAFSSAQSSSMIAFSAYSGLSNEGIRINTYTYSGDIYIRVKGSNGAYSTSDPFSLSVYVESNICGNVELPPDTLSHPGVDTEKDYKTIILWDSDGMIDYSVDAAERTLLGNQLQAFAGLPEIQGIVVDLASDPRVSFANAQAELNSTCPYAKNIVADEIKAVIDNYDAIHPLEYVVLVGNDDVIPFFRIEDESYLANESNYVPPVRDDTHSQASLRNGLILTQDPYGSRCEINLATGPYSYPGLAVGRLVESAGDAIAQLQNYANNPGGVLSVPGTSLVTGYDFLVDVAAEIENEFLLATNQPVDTLIATDEASTWTSRHLADAFLKKHHDLVFLAGHFSTGSALAADFETRLTAKQVLDSQANLLNTLVFSVGCHSGYNTVDLHAVTGITQQPDWPQAIAKLGGVLIAGTGYQYGDTEFIEYSERLYLEFARQLRTGTGDVAIGHALNKAKQKYLADTPLMRGIHEKSLTQATLFGLPMLKINVPGTRIPDVNPTNPDIVATAVVSEPGSAFGLRKATVNIIPSLVEDSRTMINSDDDSEVVVKWYKSTNLSSSNPVGFISNPSEPVRPLETLLASIPDAILRGVGFMGGTYEDLQDFIPMTGAPTTEVRAIYGNFYSDFWFPIKPYSVNALGTICGGIDGERLNVYPAQFTSNTDGNVGGILRKYNNVEFQLFYSNEAGAYPAEDLAGLTPALLASAPSIANVISTVTGGAVDFDVSALGLPAAGIQEVWVTYTGLEGSEFYGEWQSLPLVQDGSISTLWSASLPTSSPGLVRFIVQAASGTGMVAMSTNQGRYYVPGQNAAIEGVITELQLLEPVENSLYKYGDSVAVKALLTDINGIPLNNKLVGIRVENSSSMRLTDADGYIILNLPLKVKPGRANLQAYFNGAFDGDVYYSPSSAAIEIDIDEQDTSLAWLTPQNTDIVYSEYIIAQLTDGNEIPITERNVYFLVDYADDNLGEYGASVVTDLFGRASLEGLNLPTGVASVTAFFNKDIKLPYETGTFDLVDDVYNPAESINITLNIEERSLAFYPDQVDVYYKSPATKGNKPAVPIYESASIAGNVEITVPLSKEDLLESLGDDPSKISCWVEAYLGDAIEPIASGWVDLDTRGDNWNNWTTASMPGQEISFVNLHWTDVGDGSPIVAGTLNVRLSAIEGTPRPDSSAEPNLFEIRIKLGGDDGIQVRSITRVGEGFYAYPWTSEDPGHKQYRIY